MPPDGTRFEEHVVSRERHSTTIDLPLSTRHYKAEYFDGSIGEKRGSRNLRTSAQINVSISSGCLGRIEGLVVRTADRNRCLIFLVFEQWLP